MTNDNRPHSPNRTWHGPRGEVLVALQFLLLGLFIFVPVWQPGEVANWLAATAALRWAILIVCALVALLFVSMGSLHIRDYLTPLPYPVEHNELVRHGVYAIVRHPLYSSQLFAAFGWTVFNLSLSHLLVLIMGFMFFDYKAKWEETWLTERHPSYPEYARGVRKFIPWLY